MQAPPRPITLRFISGPEQQSFTPPAGAERFTVGRAAQSDLCLLHEGVSRRHASLLSTPAGWLVVHHAQRSSTRVNGERLEPEKPTPISPGDVLSFGPCTCRVSSGTGERTAPLATIDAALGATQHIEVVGVRAKATRSARRLALITDWLARITETSSTTDAARHAAQAALEGSGFPRAAVLGPPDESSAVAVLAAVASDGSEPSSFRFSRSLLEAAIAGNTAVLRDQAAPNAAHAAMSIAELGVHTAVAVPVKVGESIEACLYLDARTGESAADPEAIGYCEAIARGLALAIGEQRRRELERRQGEMSAQLAAARDVQRLLLPSPTARLGHVSYAMASRPGAFVAGDLFDAFALGEGRVCIMLGDAAGHGAGPAMLMAMTQSYLNAELRHGAGISEAIHAANRYLTNHADGGRFISLWLGIFDQTGSVEFIDAGHGHWAMLDSSGSPVPCSAAPGIPLGIDPDYEFESRETAFPPGSRLVLYTDGLTERRDPAGEEFGAERLLAAVAGRFDPLQSPDAAFDDSDAFATTPALLDDATVAIVVAN